VKEYSPLQRLNISDLSLNYNLGGSALRHFKDLVELNISNNKLDHAGAQLVRTVCEMSRILSTLDLSSCHLTVEHAASVVKAVNDNASIRSLRLNLASNDFKKDVSSLAGFLKQSKNLAYLDFSHNKIKKKGFEQILQSLADIPTLHTLVLNHACNSPDAQTASTLASLLFSNSNIRALRLSGGWGGVMSVFLPLLSKNETLEVLDVSNNKLGDIGATYVASLLTSNSTIKCMELDGNGFTISGFQAISLGLATNNTLVQLEFPWTDFERASSTLPSPKQPHQDYLRRKLIDIQLMMDRNTCGRPSVIHSFTFGSDAEQMYLTVKQPPLAHVPADLVALQNEAPPLPPYGDPASSDGNEPTDTTIPAPPPRD